MRYMLRAAGARDKVTLFVLRRAVDLHYALVAVSYHWNNFLWPLVVTNSVHTRALTVGLAIFGAPELASTGRSSAPAP